MGDVTYLPTDRTSKPGSSVGADRKAERRGILLVATDERTGAGLLMALEGQGWQVAVCAAGDVVGHLTTEPEDLVLLATDRAATAVPLTREIRRAGCDVPLVVLLSDGSADDRASVLQIGSDECLTHPLCNAELFARLDAVHRRPRCTVDPILRAGPMVLDPENGTVSIGRDALHVTKQQFAILFALAHHMGRYVDSDRLVRLSQRESNRHDASKSRVLAVVIYRLRRLLETCGAGLIIESSHGQGYRLALCAQREAV